MSRPNAFQAGIIERALDVLREATSAKNAQTLGVKLALYALRRHCPKEWLVYFWESAGTENDIGRSQNLHAAFNGIVQRVRANG